MTRIAAAADTGLPFDRRSFLASLAAAGVMTGGAAAASAAAADHPDAELIELAALLRKALARADAFDNQLVELSRSHVAPPLPAACYWERRDFGHWIGFVFDQDLGAERSPRAYSGATMVRFRRMVDQWKDSQNPTCPNDAARVRAKEIIDAFNKWERDVEAAEDAAGITAASDGYVREKDLAETLARRIPLIAARTLEGVAAKALAIRFWWGHDNDDLAQVVRNHMSDEEGDPWEAIGLSLAIDAERLCASAA